MKKLAVVVIAVGVSACAPFVSEPEPAVTITKEAPQPAVTVTEKPSSSNSDTDWEDDERVVDLAFSIAWEEMSTSEKESICRAFNANPSAAYTISGFEDIADYSKFVELFSGVC